jgi:hypothetical protein
VLTCVLNHVTNCYLVTGNFEIQLHDVAYDEFLNLLVYKSIREKNI